MLSCWECWEFCKEWLELIDRKVQIDIQVQGPPGLKQELNYLYCQMNFQSQLWKKYIIIFLNSPMHITYYIRPIYLRTIQVNTSFKESIMLKYIARSIIAQPKKYLANTLNVINSPNKIQRFSTQKAIHSHLINPYTKQLVSDKTYLLQSQIMDKTSRISKNQKQWKILKLEERIKKVQKFVSLVLKDREFLRQKISSQIGKSYKDIDLQLDQISKVAPMLIESAREALEKKQSIKTQAQERTIRYEPVGLTVIFPYFAEPIFDSLVNLIPCLISGSAALIKGSDFNHFLGEYLASKIKQASRLELICDLFLQPDDLHLISKFRAIKKVIFSGSQSSATHIFQTLVENRFIDCNLFFGGQDAAYVDQTSDLQNAALEILNSSFANNGQSYDCIKRLYIHEKVKDQFIHLLKQKLSAIVLSDPKSKQSDLGPLAIPQFSSKLESLVAQAVIEGAQCQFGGMIYSDGQSQALFFQPTLLTQCTNDMPIMQTQTLGPILCCATVSSDEQFVTAVNENKYGSGVRIFTNKNNPSDKGEILQRYAKIIQKIQVGKICFNKGSLFTANAPIQGWKSSGKGKILSKMSYQQFTLPKCYNIVNQL